MLPIERQNRIRELIQMKKSMKISDLSKEFSVSKMTIHRDLKPLISDGLIVKTFGGITLANDHLSFSTKSCIFCCRNILDQLSYRLICKNEKIEVACCAHCGLLRHQQLGKKVAQAICYDFLRHTTISAPHSWYVMYTTIDINCCQPQVLPFEWQEHAYNFAKGFGGKVYSFKQATQIVLKEMRENASNYT